MYKVFFAVALLLIAQTANGAAETNDQIRQKIIQQSIAAYPGNCPCPYNVARNGSRCGGRSAYSRPGGRSPLCFPTDVTDAMVQEYRKKQR